MLGDLPLIVSPFALTTTEQIVARTWRERWCSWPWTPWRRTRVERVEIPTMYRTDRQLIVHPALIARLRDALDQWPRGGF